MRKKLTLIMTVSCMTIWGCFGLTSSAHGEVANFYSDAGSDQQAQTSSIQSQGKIEYFTGGSTADVIIESSDFGVLVNGSGDSAGINDVSTRMAGTISNLRAYERALGKRQTNDGIADLSSGETQFSKMNVREKAEIVSYMLR